MSYLSFDSQILRSRNLELNLGMSWLFSVPLCSCDVIPCELCGCVHCTVGWRSGGASLQREPEMRDGTESQRLSAPSSSSFLRKDAFFLCGCCTLNKCVPPLLLSSYTEWDSVSCHHRKTNRDMLLTRILLFSDTQDLLCFQRMGNMGISGPGQIQVLTGIWRGSVWMDEYEQKPPASQADP